MDIPPALGKLHDIVKSDAELLQRVGWESFIKIKRRYNDFADLSTLPHRARRLLKHYQHSGAPAKMKTSHWTRQKLDAMMQRGAHQSCSQYLDFLEDEFLDMVAKGQWVILPYNLLIKLLPNLRLSPPGVVPQRERRPRWICDYTWSDVNADTLPLAPYHAMQFGLALQRLL